ncbi:MAG TPA: hypothetical protein VM779_02385, partial [Thermoanaerobaculia bacterium]|nr:hypothetical protein [Thermoanaerobaculia bacterium]
MTMHGLARLLAILAVVIPVAGTLLSLVRHPHWLFRFWDFPRVQLAVTTAAGAVAWLVFFFRGTAVEVAMLVAAAAAIAWQVYKIFPYTPLFRKQVQPADAADRDNVLALLISNVLMENEERDRLLAVVKGRAPDVLLAVETDAAWSYALEKGLGEDYPHRILQPQHNYYGM